MESLRSLIIKLTDGWSNVEEFQRYFSSVSPMYRFLGMRLVELGEGYAVGVVHYRDEISRMGGIVHGGIIASIVDHIGGIAVMTVNDGVDQVAIELKVNFLRRLSKDNSPYKAVGRVLRPGKSIVVAEARIYDSNEELSAFGVGSWYILRRRVGGW